MNGLIQYNKISTLPMEKIPAYIAANSKLVYGKITLDQLQVSGKIGAKLLHEKWEHEFFGYGAYVFFDGDTPIYVGKAKSNFKHRFQSHKHFDRRPEYAFNDFARMYAEKKLNNILYAFIRQTFYTHVINELDKLHVVRINLSSSSYGQDKAQRLEDLLNKSISDAYPGCLINAISIPARYSEKLKLDELM
ncbi:MAG TPA: hypothetical protein PLR45_06470 [Flavobacteriales bacterium]|mgnify:CR=1 FL=1|nr:hypothetical protein [Flavobacterium sp.]HRE74317.1 hypothetical protein [Flavobacteriales bacterium]